MFICLNVEQKDGAFWGLFYEIVVLCGSCIFLILFSCVRRCMGAKKKKHLGVTSCFFLGFRLRQISRLIPAREVNALRLGAKLKRENLPKALKTA
jgi:hypothetical protein